jgi:hypothetical protein
VVPSFLAFAIPPGGGQIRSSNTVFVGIQN